MKKVIRKIGLVCLGLVCLGLGTPNLLAENYNIKMEDIKNFYNFKDKKCDSLTFNDKTSIIKDLRNGYLIVNEKYKNDAGETFVIVGESEKGEEYEMILTSNYNQCRFYEDLVIKRLDVKAEAYMNKPVKK